MRNLFVKIKDWFVTNQIEILGITLIFFLSFWFRFLSLSQTPYANGWDGYFYLEQLKAWIETGKFHSPDSSLIYPYLRIVHFFCQDYILALKIGSALLAAFFSSSLWILAKILSGNKKTAWIIASITLFSPSLTFFSAEFPKNLMGLIFLNFLFISLVSRKIFQGVFFLFLSFMAHRFSAAIAVLFFMIYMAVSLKLNKKMKWAVFGILLLIPLSFFLPGTLHFYDLERFKDFLTLQFQFPPFSLLKVLGWNQFNILWIIEILVLPCGFILLLSALSYLLKKETEQKRFWILFYILLLFLIFPFFSFDINGPAYRFLFVFLLLSPLCAVLFFKNLKKRTILIFSLLFCGLSFFSYSSYQPRTFDPPYAYYQRIIEKIKPEISAHSIELIIAHKGMAEMITFLTGKDAMSWEPEFNLAKEKIWRLSSDIQIQYFTFYLKQDELLWVKTLSLNYLLIREDIWQKWIQRVKQSNDEELQKIVFSWKNPNQRRPDYLLKGR